MYCKLSAGRIVVIKLKLDKIKPNLTTTRYKYSLISIRYICSITSYVNALAIAVARDMQVRGSRMSRGSRLRSRCRGRGSRMRPRWRVSDQ